MKSLNLPIFICALLAAALLAGTGLYRLRVDTDIMKYLPRRDPVIANAASFLKTHPMQNRIIIDISLRPADPDHLAACCRFAEAQLSKSGLFEQVGTDAFQAAFPLLMSHVLENLPVLFTAEELQTEVRPLAAPERVGKRLREIRADLGTLAGVGQSGMIARDPLGLRDLVLKRLSHLMPAADATVYKGRILSPDHSHALVVAVPAVSGTDTAFARKLTRVFEDLSARLKERCAESGHEAVLTPMGAYRAALDNEELVQRDVRVAIFVAMAGIALLLLFVFPRPGIGLFAFLPALAGAAAALFVFSFLHRHIPVMVLGSGGAVISITVDHGIAYLLFLDQSRETWGKQASREIRGIGLLAALTSMGAFGALSLSDFPVLEQLGQFTALGIGFSFLFVHTIFPRMFPRMPPGPSRRLPLWRLVGRLGAVGKPGAIAAVLFAGIMAFFVRPETDVSLQRMNTMSSKTAEAEALLEQVWGNQLFERVYFLTQSDSLKGLQAQGDELLGLLEADMEAGAISAGFVPAMLFPGRGRQERNLAAWRHFWTPERRGAVQGALEQASAQLGFSAEAFDPFLQAISTKTVPPGPQRVPEALRSLLGISKTPQSDWIQTGTLVPGTDYAPESVYQRYADVARLFDPSLFSLRLGELLFSTFVRMLVIIGISVVVLLLVFFVDWKLTLISLLPVLFALISTLGTLRLAGHPLDIPGLMLSIVVVGMGVDYSLFLVRSYQRSGGEDDSGFRRIQMAVFLASASTMIGFGALCLARHALLRSAGFTSLLGIAYAAFGAFLLLPPLLKRFFQDEGEEPAGNTVPRRAAARYRRRGAYPRLFARWKIRLDPMFFELPRLTKVPFEVARIMDIGCGYGVPGCWLLERFQRARLRGMDPDPERVRIAGRVFGARGVALQGQAPMVPAFEDPADLAVMLDMAHFLPDEDLALTFRRVHANLGPDRRLVLRVAVYPQKRPSLAWRMEALGYRFSRTPVHYRSADHIAAMMAAAGFAVRTTSPSGRRGELIWIIGERR